MRGAAVLNGNESMPTTPTGGMDIPLSEHIRKIAPFITLKWLLLTALTFGMEPYWIITGNGNSTLHVCDGQENLSSLVLWWYKAIWNDVVAKLGMGFLRDCHGLSEADIAEYSEGKDILLSDFIEFVEDGMEISEVLSYPCTRL